MTAMNGDRPRLCTARALGLAAGAVGVGAAAAAWLTYPRVGALTYALAASVDARRAGLRTRVVDVDGLAVTLSEGGPRDAPTVVLLHGFSADRGVWSRFVARLSADFHVVVPDLAGHGRTRFVTGAGYGAPAQAARVAGLLDALDVSRAHVVGSSMGGFVAATFARTHPERTLSLALVDAAGVTSPRRSVAEQMLDRGEPNPFLMDDPAAFPAFYALTMARPPVVPGFVKHAMAADYVARRAGLEEIWGDWRDHDLLDDHLGEITAPTLVMWGREDRLVDVTAAEVWVSGLPDARRVTYDGVGHLPMLEVPARSAADYRAFLDDVGRAEAQRRA